MPGHAPPRLTPRPRRFGALGLMLLLVAGPLAVIVPEAAAFAATDAGYEVRDNDAGDGGPPGMYAAYASIASKCPFSLVGTSGGMDAYSHSTFPSPSFEFAFAGQQVNSLFISINGGLGFAGAASELPDETSTIPDGTGPRDFVAGWWGDLVAGSSLSGSAGSICWDVTGSYPDRQFVAAWEDVAPAAPTGLAPVPQERVRFAIVAFEASDVIEVHYGGGCGDRTQANIIGLEHGSGTGVDGVLYTESAPGAPCIGPDGRGVQYRPTTTFANASDDVYYLDFSQGETSLTADGACTDANRHVLCNDTQIGNVPLSAAAWTNPRGGTLSATDTDGSFTFDVPTGDPAWDPCNWGDPYTFTYHADDAFTDDPDGDDVGTVKIHVTDCPPPPPKPQPEADDLYFLSQPSDTGVGLPFLPSVAVRALDGGTPFDGEVMLEIADGPPDASFLNGPGQEAGGTEVVAKTDAEGVAAFSGLALDRIGKYRLKASVDASTVLSEWFTIRQTGAEWPQHGRDGTRHSSAGGSADFSTRSITELVLDPGTSATSTALSSPLVLDLNSNGILDVVAVTQIANGPTMIVHAFEQDLATGTTNTLWQTVIPNPLPGGQATLSASSIVAGQLVDGGAPELAVVYWYETNARIASIPSPGFQNGGLMVLDGATGSQIGATITQAGNNRWMPGVAPAIGDIDGDGTNELLAMYDGAAPTLSAYNVTTSLNLEFEYTASTATFWTAMVIADAVPDKDSVGAGHNGHEIFLGGWTSNAAGTYVTCLPEYGVANCTTEPSTTTAVMGMSAGDVTGDGRPELIANGRSPNSATTSEVFTVDPSDGSLTSLRPFVAARQWNTPPLGDVDGDYILDVVNMANDGFVGGFHDGDITIRGIGPSDWDKGNLARPASTPDVDYRGTRGAALLDVNGDGRPELVAGTFDADEVQAYQTGNPPSFQWGQSPPSAQGDYSPVAAGDTTGDCRPEILVGTASGTLLVLSGAPSQLPSGAVFNASTGGIDYTDAANWTMLNPSTSPGKGLQAKLAWNRPADDGGLPVVGYHVYRVAGLPDGAGDGGADDAAYRAGYVGFWPSGTPPTVEHPFIDSVGAAGDYYYKVAAVTCLTLAKEALDDEGDGAGNLSVPFYVELRYGDAPTDLETNITKGGLPAYAGPATIRVNWTAAADNFARPHGCGPVDSYNVYRRVVGGAGVVKVNPEPVTDLELLDTPLPGAMYEYRVHSVNCIGENATGATVLADLRFAAPPTDLSADPTTASVSPTLSWTPPTDIYACGWIEGYAVDRGPSASGPWTQLAHVLDGDPWPKGPLADPASSTVQYTDDAVDLGATYHYRVRTVNCAGANTTGPTTSFLVEGINDPPVISVPIGVTGIEDTERTLAGTEAIRLSDPGADPALDAVLNISSTALRMTLAATDGLTFEEGDGNADKQTRVRGTLADLNAALDGAVLRPESDLCGELVLELELDDLGNSGGDGPKTTTRSWAVPFTCSEDAPVITADAPTLLEDDEHVQDVQVTDADGETPTLSLAVAPENGTAELSGTTLTYTPAADHAGTDKLTLEACDATTCVHKVVSYTISEVNDAPVILAVLDRTVLEDAGDVALDVGFEAALGPASEADQAIEKVEITHDRPATWFDVPPMMGPDGVLHFRTAEHMCGVARLTLHVVDDGGTPNGGENRSAPESMDLHVTCVNDGPVIQGIAQITVNEDVGKVAQRLIVGIQPGPTPDEADQSTTAPTMSVTDASMFSMPPVLDADIVRFEVWPDACGATELLVTVRDDGGTADGGSDETVRRVPLTVQCVNDPPRASVKTLEYVEDETDAQILVPGFVQNVHPGGGFDEGEQSTTYTVLFGTGAEDVLEAPAVDSNGDLTFRLVPDGCGNHRGKLLVQDDGGIDHGGSDRREIPFGIVVHCVNDPPAFAPGGSIELVVGPNPGPQTFPRWATQITPGAANEGHQSVTFTVSTTVPELFASIGVGPEGTLALQPVAKEYGTAMATVCIRDDGPSGNQGSPDGPCHDILVTILDRNDQPTFVPGKDIMVLEDSGAYEAVWARGVSAGPEEDQAVEFEVTAEPATMFTSGPDLRVEDGNGILTFTPAPDQIGEAIVTVRLQDDGGTRGGGIDTSGPAVFRITLTNIPDAPVAMRDQYGMLEDTVFTLPAPGVLSNDVDPDHDPLSVRVVRGPQQGDLDLDADGRIEYTPPRDFAGVVDFIYEARDITGRTSQAIVTIDVGNTNDPPEAVADYYAMRPDTSNHFEEALGLTANDVDADGEPLRVLIPHLEGVPGRADSWRTQHGVLHMLEHGAFTYIPDTGYRGQDDFIYIAEDSAGARSAPVIVRLEVTDNAAPVAKFKATALEATLTEQIGFHDMSYDPDAQRISPGHAENNGTALARWTWDFGDGTTLDRQNPTHTYTAPGTYTVRLTVTDFEGAQGTATQEITVLADHRPEDGGEARARPQVTAPASHFVHAGDPVHLLGELISGGADVYTWSQAEGPTVFLHGADNMSAMFNAPQVPDDAHFLALGFQFRAFDGVLWSPPANVTVIVYDDGVDPRATAEDREVQVGAQVRLKADLTGFPAGSKPLQSWTQVGGPFVGVVGSPSDGAGFIVPARAAGETLEFTVVGQLGALRSPPATVRVTVTDAAPALDFDAERVAPGTYRFVAPPGAEAYTWDFGDGQTGSGAEVVHRFEAGGTYRVQLAAQSGSSEDRHQEDVWVPETFQEAQSVRGFLGDHLGIILLALAGFAVVAGLLGTALTRRR